MTSAPDSLRSWLCQHITHALRDRGTEPPFLIWCDPERVWRDLLFAAAQGGSFEVWADDIHELLLRERFYTTPRARRVIWLPAAREDISYFKVFELQAADVQEWTLPEALSAYGVDIPSDQLADLRPLLSAQLQKLEDALFVEYTYESNRIEGSTLTLQETALIIHKGITVAGKSMREHLEAINHSTNGA